MTLALDGSATAYSTNTSYITISLSTTKPNDVIIVSAFVYNGTVSSISDTANLSWKFRAHAVISNTFDLEEWYAISPNALSSDSIQVNYSGGGGSNVGIAYGISGANTAAPFDSNSTLPATATSTVSSSVAKAAISTSNANDFIIGTVATQPSGNITITAGSGFTEIAEASPLDNYIFSEYQIVTATQSNFSVSVNFSPSTTGWEFIADAIVAAPPPTSSPYSKYSRPRSKSYMHLM